MLWQCRHCQATNPGLQGEDEGLRCKGCGSQRSDEPWIMPDVNAAPAVTDKALQRRANAGAVWVCKFCQHSERNEHKACSVCGAERFERQTLLPPPTPVPPRQTMKLPTLIACATLLLSCTSPERAANTRHYNARTWAKDMDLPVWGLACTLDGICDLNTGNARLIQLYCDQTGCERILECESPR